MGQEKGKDNCGQDCEKEGRNHCGWPQTALAAYESTLGGTQKSKRKEVSSAQPALSQRLAASPG